MPACHPLLIRCLDLSPRPFLHGACPCYITLRPQALLQCGCWASLRPRGSTLRYFRDFAPAVPLTLDLHPQRHPLWPSLLHNSLHLVQPRWPECFFLLNSCGWHDLFTVGHLLLNVCSGPTLRDCHNQATHRHCPGADRHYPGAHERCSGAHRHCREEGNYSELSHRPFQGMYYMLRK